MPRASAKASEEVVLSPGGSSHDKPKGKRNTNNSKRESHGSSHGSKGESPEGPGDAKRSTSGSSGKGRHSAKKSNRSKHAIEEVVHPPKRPSSPPENKMPNREESVSELGNRDAPSQHDLNDAPSDISLAMSMSSIISIVPPAGVSECFGLSPPDPESKKHDKAQIYVRINPNPDNPSDYVFEVGPEQMTLGIHLEPDTRIPSDTRPPTTPSPPAAQKDPTTPVQPPPPPYLSFETDGIFPELDQQEKMYEHVVEDIVEKAIHGVSSAIVCLGPEQSGKNYTLFGPLTKHEFRGLVPRAMERIFELIADKKHDEEFRVIFSMLHIKRNRIKDLLTLGPYELKRVGNCGPYGLFYEEITTAEQGSILLLRGLLGQKELFASSVDRIHTLVYIDILAKGKSEGQPTERRSRITFAKLASIPLREEPIQRKTTNPKENLLPLFSFPTGMPVMNGGYFNCISGLGKETGFHTPINWNVPSTTDTKEVKIIKDPCSQPRDTLGIYRAKIPSNCCCGQSEEQMDVVSVRKDFYLLEQMFTRANELRKIFNYYNTLRSMGMFMLVRPPRLAPSQYFRQSKLAHCLKDIVSGNIIVRVILHLRPEKVYLHSTLEALRFATRAKSVPITVPVPVHSTVHWTPANEEASAEPPKTEEPPPKEGEEEHHHHSKDGEHHQGEEEEGHHHHHHHRASHGRKSRHKSQSHGRSTLGHVHGAKLSGSQHGSDHNHITIHEDAAAEAEDEGEAEADGEEEAVEVEGVGRKSTNNRGKSTSTEHERKSMDPGRKSGKVPDPDMTVIHPPRKSEPAERPGSHGSGGHKDAGTNPPEGEELEGEHQQHEDIASRGSSLSSTTTTEGQEAVVDKEVVFTSIRTIAKHQVDILLKAHPKRPPWTNIV